jgi:arylsulfatase A-like enzyme
MDIFATAAALAGATLPADRPIDGVDLRPVLTGLAPSPRHLNFYYWDDELRAIRKDRFKAHFITSGAYNAFGERKVHDTPLLFDLAADPGERFDVAAAHPDVVADLVREADAHRKAMVMGKPLFDRLIAPTATSTPNSQPPIRKTP